MAIAVLMGLVAPPAQAATLWWDGGRTNIPANGNGASQGGSGIWNTTIRNWDAGAVPHANWVNANNDTAVFGGTAGRVTNGADITVGRLIFATANYVLTNSILTFGTAGSISNSGTATFGCCLAGSA